LGVVAETFRRRGITEPEKHMLLLNYSTLDTLLIKKEPFTDNEIKSITAKAHKMGFNLYPQNETAKLLDESDPYLVTDDNPFFFNDWIGRSLILSIIRISVILLSILIIIPLLLKGNLKAVKTLNSLAYFLAIGAGYMLIEIPLIQRFSLLLGAPTLSFTVIIFTLLASTGLGSLHARKLAEKLNLVFVLLMLLIVMDTLFLPTAIKKLSVLPLAGRILATVLLLFPLGVLLGVFFPTGIRKVSEREAETIPWMWGMNSIASVIGATAAPYIAIQRGFTTVLALSIPLYALAYLILKKSFKGSVD
jgi:hypothetical protein